MAHQILIFQNNNYLEAGKDFSMPRRVSFDCVHLSSSEKDVSWKALSNMGSEILEFTVTGRR